MKKSLLILLICSGNLFGQFSEQQFFATYKEGVSLFEEARYDEAFTKLSTLTNRNHTNAVAPYAYLYAAQAAEKKGNKYQAKILYRNLLTYYPDWDKIDEAKILYGRINLEDGYYEEGLKALHEVDSKALNPLKIRIMEEYIKNVKTISALKALYNKYPNYKPVALALVDKIQSNRYNTKADLELSDMLTNRFGSALSEKSDESTPSHKKSSGKVLNFGILLPFELSSADPTTASFRYIYDLYAGMTVAAEKLSSQKINISLHTYDIKSDAEAFKNAEKKAGFSDLDLVVGPLYPAPNTLAQKFVNDNQVIHVHPTSNNLSLLTASKNAFLMQPSHAQQAKKALDYASSAGLPKTVSIYFGEARKDSLFARIYADEARKRGYTVNEIRKFTGQKLPPQRGHVFLAADNNLGVRFLQSVAMNDIDCEVILTASSFNWDRLNTSSFTPKVALIYPEYVNREREPVKEFEKNYFEKTAALPSYYSYLGYDLVYYFGSMLKDGQNAFQRHIERGEYVDDYLLSGYDFSDKVKQNDIVPIVKFRDNNFEEVYR